MKNRVSIFNAFFFSVDHIRLRKRLRGNVPKNGPIDLLLFLSNNDAVLLRKSGLF